MARYKIDAVVEDTRITTVQNKIKELFKDSHLTVSKVNDSPSRADRLGEAESLFEQVKELVQELHDEIEEWHSNLPENLQSSGKADELQECMDALDEITQNLDNVDFSNVSFPSMM